MLRCLAGICGTADTPALEEAQRRQVLKPILRLDTPTVPEKVQTTPELVAYGLQLAPPGSEVPVAVVSSDFNKNSARLLIVIPGPGAASCWDAELEKLGYVEPLFRWAEANGYATAFFSHQALCQSPVDTWDRIVRGSPARHVSVMVAAGMLNVMEAALKQVHPLLFSRFRTVCIHGGDTMEDFASSPVELRQHLEATTVVLPSNWEGLERQVALQCLFELLRDREDHWAKLELMKYTGFQSLKENDLPGLKRMGVDQRVQRLNRDRNDDELARLLKKHDKARTDPTAEIASDEEPGVD